MKNMLNKLVLTALNEFPPDKALDYVLSLLREDKASMELESGGRLKFPVSSYLIYLFFSNLIFAA